MHCPSAAFAFPFAKAIFDPVRTGFRTFAGYLQRTFRIFARAANPSLLCICKRSLSPWILLYFGAHCLVIHVFADPSIVWNLTRWPFVAEATRWTVAVITGPMGHIITLSVQPAAHSNAIEVLNVLVFLAELAFVLDVLWNVSPPPHMATRTLRFLLDGLLLLPRM